MDTISFQTEADLAKKEKILANIRYLYNHLHVVKLSPRLPDGDDP